MHDIKAQVEYQSWNDEMLLWFRIRNYMNNEDTILKFNFETIERNVAIPQNRFALPHDNPFGAGIGSTRILQEILNASWNAGMRPLGFKNTQDEKAAMSSHLEDLRKISFKLLKIEGVK